MKKNFLSFVICAIIAAFTSVSFVSCGLSEKTLEAAIEQANKDYPKEMMEGLTAEKITMNADYIIYNYTVDESIIPFEAVQPTDEEFAEELKQTYDSDENTKTFVALAVTAGKSIKRIYTGSESGETVEVVVSNSTLAGF